MPDLIAINGFTHRVPAWKKLGLKLKYAKDNNGDGGSDENVKDRTGSVASKSELGKKRNRDSDDHDISNIKSSQSKPKELKISSSTRTQRESTLTRPDQTSRGKRHSTAFQNSAPTAQASNSLSSTKRRSVTFTPDTKENDGDSIKQLYNAWVERQKAEDPQFRPEKVHQALKPLLSKLEADKKTKKRKLRKDKSSLGHPSISDTPTSTPLHIHPAIAYLVQYHQHREQWKFNKAKQSYLLKHILDLDRIPREYDKALVIYISNLQSQAARARVKEAMTNASREWRFPISIQRLMDAARDADYWSEMTPEDLENDPRWQKHRRQEAAWRHEIYEGALEKFLDALRDKGIDALNEGYSTDLYSTDAKLARKLDRAKRAEAILWALSQQGGDDTPQDEVKRARSSSENVGDSAEKRAKLNDGSAQCHVRKRKLRTNATEIESDSSQSSSSGSKYFSASEELVKPDASGEDDHDEDSSGSSGSSSDSDDSSDSESDSEDETDVTDETDSDEESDDDG